MQEKERVILVGCQTIDVDEQTFMYSMVELHQLVQTAGGTVVATMTQKRKYIEPSTYIGAGKLEELVRVSEETDADVIIFNDELTSSHVTLRDRRTCRSLIVRSSF